LLIGQVPQEPESGFPLADAFDLLGSRVHTVTERLARQHIGECPIGLSCCQGRSGSSPA
jgi:hypothetical protein